jgi:hypothetical protein
LAFIVTNPYVAEIVTKVGDETAWVAIENAGEIAAPPGTVMEAGTEATCGFELESETTAPFAGAKPARATVFEEVVNPP